MAGAPPPRCRSPLHFPVRRCSDVARRSISQLAAPDPSLTGLKDQGVRCPPTRSPQKPAPGALAGCPPRCATPGAPPDPPAFSAAGHPAPRRGVFQGIVQHNQHHPGEPVRSPQHHVIEDAAEGRIELHRLTVKFQQSGRWGEGKQPRRLHHRVSIVKGLEMWEKRQPMPGAQCLLRLRTAWLVNWPSGGVFCVCTSCVWPAA